MAVSFPKNQYARLGLIGAGVVVGLAAVRYASRAASGVVNMVTDSTVQSETGADAATMSAAKVIVTSVYDEIHGSWFGDDEDYIIRCLNGVKTEFQVKLISSLYRARYHRSLKVDVENSLSDGINAIPVAGSVGAAISMSKINNIVKKFWY